MRKLLTILAAVMLWSTSAPAEDWTEIDVSAFENIGGSFEPQAKISLLNFINDRGIGLYVGQDEQAGPLASWRVWRHTWGFGMDNAIHIIGSSDLVNGGSAFDNGRTGFDIRWGWSGAADIKVTTKLTWEFVEGRTASWTPSIGFVIMPGADSK